MTVDDLKAIREALEKARFEWLRKLIDENQALKETIEAQVKEIEQLKRMLREFGVDEKTYERVNMLLEIENSQPDRLECGPKGSETTE